LVHRHSCDRGGYCSLRDCAAPSRERKLSRRSKRTTTPPDFSLPDLSNKAVTLSSYHGEVVLLDFWATWCEPCRDETPHFVDIQNKYGPQGLQILGISMDDSSQPVRDFAQQYHVNYPLVMGTAKTGQLYGGILGLPVFYLIDRDGRIRARHIGPTDPSVLEKEIADLLQAPASQN